MHPAASFGSTGRPAVIVVNSLVARGGIGGRASVFALERLGFPVWSVPTVVLPWHPGHGKAARIVAPTGAFAQLLADLEGSPHVAEVGAILTGYIGEAGQIAPIARLIASLKSQDPNRVYLCDPVIGDAGGLFQPEPLAAAIRRDLLPLADMATPNRHELAWLDGAPASDNRGLAAAARRLGPAEVIVTSAFAGAGSIANLCVTPEAVATEAHPALPAAPHGTGDLFAGLYLGHRLGGRSAAEATREAARATAAVAALAVRDGADELPLAAGQDLFAAVGVDGKTAKQPHAP